MNGTDRASHYPYRQYHQHQHPYHHHYQQRPQHPHHSLPSLAAAAAAAGSFPFNFDVDSLPTAAGRPVDPTAGSRGFTTPPLSTTAAAECCYQFDEGVRRYGTSDGVPATAAAYLGFRSTSTRRSDTDARFAAAEMTSQTASPADCSGGGLLADGKCASRPTPGNDTKENGLQFSSASISNHIRGCSDDLYDALPRHHERLSTDDKTDDVIKNANKTDSTAASPSRDHVHHCDKKTKTEDSETKRDVSKLCSPASCDNCTCVGLVPG